MRLTFLLLILVLGTITFPFTYAETSVEKIDINSASVEILDRELNGIGPKKAAAIVEYREQNGPFKSIEDIQKVYGIGEKTFEKNRDKIIAIQPEDSSTPEKPAEASPTESKTEEVPATDSVTPIDD
jgi:competence protein ComEA